MAALWFKNAHVFRITALSTMEPIENLVALSDNALRPCGKLEPSSAGWVSPIGNDDLCHIAGGCTLLRYGIEERVLPAAVVKRKVQERAAAYLERTGAKPSRREVVNLRDEVLMELLPQAFVKPSHIDCYIDTVGMWFVVNTSSMTKADDVAALLRKTFPDLKLQVIDAPERIRSTLTRWLNSMTVDWDENAPFQKGASCDLCDQAEARATWKARNSDLETREIAEHLRAGKIATAAELIFKERLRFTLTDKFALKQIRAEDVAAEQFDDLADAATRLDAEFVFIVLEFRQMLDGLVEAFGLEVQS